MVQHPRSPTESQPEVQYERQDVSYRALVWALVGLAVLAIATHLIVAGLFDLLYERHAPVSDSADMALQQPDLPDLQANADPRTELQQLHSREEDLLRSPPSRVPGHDDVVRIPVDRAMDLILERGLPGGRPPQTSLEAPDRQGQPQSQDQPRPDPEESFSPEGRGTGSPVNLDPSPPTTEQEED